MNPLQFCTNSEIILDSVSLERRAEKLRVIDSTTSVVILLKNKKHVKLSQVVVFPMIFIGLVDKLQFFSISNFYMNELTAIQFIRFINQSKIEQVSLMYSEENQIDLDATQYLLTGLKESDLELSIMFTFQANTSPTERLERKFFFLFMKNSPKNSTWTKTTRILSQNYIKNIFTTMYFSYTKLTPYLHLDSCTPDFKRFALKLLA